MDGGERVVLYGRVQDLLRRMRVQYISLWGFCGGDAFFARNGGLLSVPARMSRASCYTTEMPNLALGDMCEAGPKAKSFRDVSSSESTGLPFSLGSGYSGL
jgi:hypothetical protein